MKLPILNYHGIQSFEGEFGWTEAERPYVLGHAEFDLQLEALVQSGFHSLNLKELNQWLENGRTVEKPVFLSFDDGPIGHFQYAAPALKRRSMKAIFFVSAALVGKPGQMDWKELLDLLRQGFEIGSHGLRHIPLTQLSESDLLEEIAGSKKILEERLGIPILSFSVPRGFYAPRISDLAKRAGYRCVFTSKFDLNKRGADPMQLKRLVVKANCGEADFLRMIYGKLGPKGVLEALKNNLRQTMSPDLYDKAALLKRKLILR